MFKHIILSFKCPTTLRPYNSKITLYSFQSITWFKGCGHIECGQCLCYFYETFVSQAIFTHLTSVGCKNSNHCNQKMH